LPVFFGLPTDPEVEDIFQLFDNNNDGIIDFKEFLIGISSIHQKQLGDNATEKFVEYCFTLFDKDGKGTIGKEEFIAIITKQVPNMSKQRVEEIFNLMGGDKTQEVSYEQFLDFAKNNPIYLKLAKTIVKRNRPDEYVQLGLSAELKK